MAGAPAARPLDMPRPAQPPQFDGALVVNKPAHVTSHDVVEVVRRLAGFRHVGHLGTLDPLATGVLVILLGRATRLARFFSVRRKRYTCAVYFGFATDTYDADGEPAGPDAHPALDPDQLREIASRLTGRIMQTPPPFSAKKVGGRPAHELARRHKAVSLEPVKVEVFEFRLTAVEGQIARFVMECGSGTYVRALAHDLGCRLGCGAHIQEIVRTAVGEFTLDQAASLEELAEAAGQNRFRERVLPLENLLPDLPRFTVLPVIERRVRHGANFAVSPQHIQPGMPAAAQGAPAQLDAGEKQPPRLRVFGHDGRLIAIAEAVVPRTYRPIVVLDAAP
jgi:tRNA pseudouridine55 synthase